MRSLVVVVAVILPLGSSLVGCSAKLNSNLKLDDAEFKPTECRSGQAFSFGGIQLADAAGHRVRLFMRETGSVNVAIFAPGQDHGDELDDCGTLVVTQQNSTINDIKNVQGKATLACKGAGHSLSGTIEFENCH
jgi:hypothetical protein